MNLAPGNVKGAAKKITPNGDGQAKMEEEEEEGGEGEEEEGEPQEEEVRKMVDRRVKDKQTIMAVLAPILPFQSALLQQMCSRMCSQIVIWQRQKPQLVSSNEPP